MLTNAKVSYNTDTLTNIVPTENLTTEIVSSTDIMWEVASQTDADTYDEQFWKQYDYKGAIFFVFGLLFIYISAILILVIAMIRRSRSELYLIDQLHDLEELRKKNRAPPKKRSSRWKLSSLTDRLSRKSSSVDDGTLDDHPIAKMIETRVKMNHEIQGDVYV